MACTLCILFASPASGQQIVDRRSTTLPSRNVVIDGSCTVFGDGGQGRPQGLTAVSGAAIMRDSSVLIFDAGSSELLIFGSSGRFLSSHGGAGDGPGEFTRVGRGRSYRAQYAVAYRGDSLAVYDAPSTRISIFDAKGKLGRSFELRAVPNARRAVINGSTPTGDFILVVLAGFITDPRPQSGSFVRQDSVLAIRLDPTGAVKWVSLTMPGAMLDVVILSSATQAIARGQRHTMTGTSGATYPFSYFMSIVEANGLVHHYRESTNEIWSFGGQGQLVRRLLLPKLPVALQPGAGNVKQALSMIRDDTGRIWLEIPRAHREETRDWWIISESGDIAATARMHGKVEPLWIGRARILLRAIDADGVETVRSCALRGS